MNNIMTIVKKEFKDILTRSKNIVNDISLSQLLVMPLLFTFHLFIS